jgi:hypothetical protein
MIALNIAAFQPVAEFGERMERYIWSSPDRMLGLFWSERGRFKHRRRDGMLVAEDRGMAIRVMPW